MNYPAQGAGTREHRCHVSGSHIEGKNWTEKREEMRWDDRNEKENASKGENRVAPGSSTCQKMRRQVENIHFEFEFGKLSANVKNTVPFFEELKIV